MVIQTVNTVSPTVNTVSQTINMVNSKRSKPNSEQSEPNRHWANIKHSEPNQVGLIEAKAVTSDIIQNTPSPPPN